MDKFRAWVHDNFYIILVAYILATLLNIAISLNFLVDVGRAKTQAIKVERAAEADRKAANENFKNIDQSLMNHKAAIEFLLKNAKRGEK